MDAIDSFARHVVGTRFEDLPGIAVAAAKTFILDTLGVGIAGSSGPMARELAEAQTLWGEREEARVWGTAGCCRRLQPRCATPVRRTTRKEPIG